MGLFGKTSCFLRLPLVVAKVEAQHEKRICDLSWFSLQSGKGAVSKGGSLWRAFLVRSLPRGKE